MYQKGDYIVYRSTGVCRVEEVGIPTDFPAAVQGVQYYQLSPVRGAGTIYIPVDSKVFMRPVISREQALELIASIPSIEERPNYSKDQKALTAHYKALLQTHDCITLVQLIKDINKKARVLSEKGKSAGKTDTQYRKQAEELLREELSIALGIPLAEVSDYIKAQLNAPAI